MENLLLAIGAFLFGFFSKSLYDQTYLLMTDKVIANIPTPEELPSPIPLTNEEQTILTYIKKQLNVMHLDIQSDSLTLESRFVEDFYFDSLDAVELMMNLEDEYSFDIHDEALPSIKTIQDVVDYIVRRNQE